MSAVENCTHPGSCTAKNRSLLFVLPATDERISRDKMALGVGSLLHSLAGKKDEVGSEAMHGRCLNPWVMRSALTGAMLRRW